MLDLFHLIETHSFQIKSKENVYPYFVKNIIFQYLKTKIFYDKEKGFKYLKK